LWPSLPCPAKSPSRSSSFQRRRLVFAAVASARGTGTGPGLAVTEAVVFDLDLDRGLICDPESALIRASGLSTNGGASPPFMIIFVNPDPALTLILLAGDDPALVLLDPTLVLLDPTLTLLDPVTDIDPDPCLPCTSAPGTDAALIVRSVPAIEDLEYL
jgi:hypothetical protein